MSNSLPITLQIVAVLALSVLLGYGVGRTSRRAGISLATAGIFLGLILIVNYFVEVPVAVVAAGFVALAASMVLGLFDVIRKDVAAHPG
jgi:hypothetical protein